MENKNLLQKINAIRNEMSVIGTGSTEAENTATGKKFKGWTYIQLSDFLPELQNKINGYKLFYSFENSEIKTLKINEKKETIGTVSDVETVVFYRDIRLVISDLESEETTVYTEQYFFDTSTSSKNGIFSNESYTRRKMLINFFGIVENDEKEQYEADMQQKIQKRETVQKDVIPQNLNAHRPNSISSKELNILEL